MSSRYPPPRDRSPPRHFDRRPSATSYAPGASSYRGTGDPQTSSLDRPPPRGPKADFRGGGYPFNSAPRGRGGFPSRAGDTWDRDRERDRDTRNAPPTYYRDEERNDRAWRDREFQPSDRGAGFQRERAYVGGRDRSASPDRPRRNSKESLPSTFNRPTETTSSYYGPATRGGTVRGRGRGDWDRIRGRSSFVLERDREFFPRSRSREEWQDRDYDRGRASGVDTERGERYNRREYDRPDERDVRNREHDGWQRDRSPGRNSTGRPVSPGALSNISQHGERYKPDHEIGRKPSLGGPLSARSEGRREPDSDYFASRVETPRREGPLPQSFPTSSVPQSSALGLDYGPPLSVPATTPSTQDKPVVSKPQAVKPEPPSAPAALQPPSGPKADRVGPPPNAPSTPRIINQHFEQWPKSEPTSRPLRPGPPVIASPSVNDPNWKSGDTAPETRAQLSTPVDRPLPANVPSGPRATSGNFRGRLLSNEQVAPNAPPTAPRQPKANTLENRPVPNAPTGPRSSTFPVPGASHNVPPAGPQAGSNRQWVAPDYRPAKPSIMNQMNKPYQPDVRERSSISGPTSRPGGVTYQSQQARPKITQPLSGESASQILFAKAIGSMADIPSGAQTPMDEDMVDSPADVEMSLPASDEDDVEDDDGLDEDYFATSEETHLREMKLLESKKPLPPLLDPATAALIVRIQLLGMLANDIVPEAYEAIKASAESAMDLDNTPTNAPPSPERTPEESSAPTLEHPMPRGRPLSQPLINPIPTPPIDVLPYLNGAMEDCHVFEETENDSDNDSTRMLLCEKFEHDAWEEEGNLHELRTFYKSRYPQWKREVEQAELRLREVHQPSPAPASPAPSATPSLPPGPERLTGERTRGARNTTDLDMQQAILMSQQSAKEEEERREREAASNALPNYESEAVVPFMIKPSEVDLYHFEDMNKMISQEFALDIYGFVPSEDDFTDEEQATFIAAYCQNPKKWGKIAELLPGRTYQDCIAHYYLTKDKANYKEHWRRSQPKRGRRRAANVKPRANNLISDLALNEEGEGTPVAVTDSGRPRRAAAPTFGDVPDQDAVSTAPQAKKLKDSLKDADPAQPKARGRKGTGSGKGRKPKDKVLIDPSGQILLPAASVDASPHKLDRAINGKEKLGRSALKAETNTKLEPYSMSALTAQVPLDVNKTGPGDMSSNSVGPAPVQVTSYWSVPEQQKFPYLVQYFGRDFAAIAGFLKTKSAIMIKNYYMRELSNGKAELEHYATLAEEKRARGEPMGPPPTPVQPPKRRYEATPSMAAIPRSTASTSEHTGTDTESGVSVTKTIIEEFPSNSIQRVAGEVVAKPRPPRELVHHSPVNVHVHPKIEDPPRNERPSLLQKTLQGPPRGLFQDEPVIYPQHQKVHASIPEASPHQRPTQVMDHRPVETRVQQPVQHVEMRSSDFNRGFAAHNREQLLQPQQAVTLSQYQPISDRPLHPSIRTSHSRHPSLTNNKSNHEQAAVELASLRNMDITHNVAYNPSTTRSPIAVPAQAATCLKTNGEPHSAIQAIAQRIEPPKPAPAKRSNVFGLLNDDPPEPPVKRPSLESAKRNVNTPPPQSMSTQSSIVQPRHQEEHTRPPQSAFGQSNRIDPVRQEYRQDYSSSPAPSHPTDPWLDRWDPRQQSQGNEQRQTQQSPAPSSYSVVPPNTQSNLTTSIPARFDPARNIESAPHRRTLLGIGHAPSPPPQQSQQQQQQSVHTNRTSSASSQHGRGPSISYQATASSGAPNYPHSTSSTPIPTLHHRSQLSIDNQPKLTIQQHMREQQQAQAIHAQRREIDVLHQHQQQQQQQQQQAPPPSQPQHSQQPPSQPPSRLSDRREIYGSGPESRTTQQHHVAPPSSQTPQPQQLNIGYPTAPPQPPGRTYTPPHPSYGSSTGIGGHGHNNHNHQQQYQSHQSQYSHNASQSQGQHHQPYSSHPSYGAPPPVLPHQRNVHALGNTPQPSQNHYRGYSTEERR